MHSLNSIEAAATGLVQTHEEENSEEAAKERKEERAGGKGKGRETV